MNTRRCLTGLFVSLVLAVTLPQSAAAQVAGPQQGVTAARTHHGVVVRFGKGSARVYRRIAGRRIVIGCSTVTRLIGGYSTDSESVSGIRAPRHRQTLHTYVTGRADFCFIRLDKTHETIVMAPVTKAGGTYIDELMTFSLMLFVPFESAAAPDLQMPTIDQAVADGHGLVVALDGPDGIPPHGKIGYWTDGTHTVVAAVTAAGRRMFFDIDGDVMSTNALAYLTASSGD
jgi:hypothetical protein